MRKIWILALALGGCGANATTEAGTMVNGAVETEGSADVTVVMDFDEGVAPTDAPAAELPDAPWNAEAVAAQSVPRELITAWNTAENRDWCAPLAVRDVSGARARRARYNGGWAVEFDKRGLPGITPGGRACTRCGRGAFGIAGTGLMTDEEDPTEAEEHVMRDGSRVRIEVGEDEEGQPSDAHGVVATIKINGQGCVYQVWSFGGDEHLQELLRDLRFVER